MVLTFTMTSEWTWWCLKSPASWLFVHSFIQAQIKENIKALRHWPLWGGNPPVTSGFPTQRASYAEMFPFDDIIMTLPVYYGFSTGRVTSEPMITCIRARAYVPPHSNIQHWIKMDSIGAFMPVTDSLLSFVMNIFSCALRVGRKIITHHKGLIWY